jgi:hypothetical protein
VAPVAQILDQRAAQAQTLQSGGAVAPPPGCANTPSVAHGGPYGFFQAPGTNYSVNQEPIIAARLDQLGKALQLHLIGVSGYRTPQHSVEVSGFADDPHTQGLASDTPGVEGVPESTLHEFCLTRPFPGAPGRPITSRSRSCCGVPVRRAAGDGARGVKDGWGRAAVAKPDPRRDAIYLPHR